METEAEMLGSMSTRLQALAGLFRQVSCLLFISCSRTHSAFHSHVSLLSRIFILEGNFVSFPEVEL